ncbi:MAG: substrate-binding domain-containing protein [Urechidicola sp.]|nr:substrate-binding domain-containing protein [Urechidicola sp.]
MTTLKIGGVAEHFNMPWHLAIENNEFKKENIDLVWKDFPGGTGAMSKALRNGELDIAVLLTEGIIKDIIDGNPSKIVQTYINSPLLWGLHVGAESKYNSVEELENKVSAISRVGSGSQLFSIVNAKNNGWDIDKIEYQVVNNLVGAIDALTNESADYFLWEHFTAKPLVDNGTFRRLADIPSPWPCFVIAVRDEVLANQPEEIKNTLRIINNRLSQFSTLAKKERYIDTFAQLYNLEKEDVKNWLIITEWNQGKSISRTLIDKVQNELLNLNIISKKIDTNQLIHKIRLS